MTKYTKSDKLNIGKETFYRLLETEYNFEVKEEIKNKYGINASQLSTYLSMFKNNIVEPKPTEEEKNILQNYYQRRLSKNYNHDTNKVQKEYSLVKQLLMPLTKEEMKLLLDRYNLTYIKARVKDYLVAYPLAKEKLDYVLNELENINKENIQKRKDERTNAKNDEKKDYIEIVINEYLNGIDIYPNYVFNKYSITSDKFNSWIKVSELPGNEPLKELINNYYKELKVRELSFVNNTKEIVNLISLDNLGLLDFYRITHTPIYKFKLFMYIASRRGLITNEVLTILENYIKKYEYGSFEYSSIDELKKDLNFNYNGLELTSEQIDNICIELQKEMIPINKSTVIELFKEQNQKYVNKR